MRKDITGIILCGGKSSRMKTNKALLKFGDITTIEILTNKLSKIFNKVLISANSINEYSFLNLSIVKDKYINKGPLAGIYSALEASETEKNFIISCDMPLVSIEIINYLTDFNSNKKILLPKVNGKIQKLCGVYSKSIIEEIEKLILQSEIGNKLKGSVYELIERVPTELIDVEPLIFYNQNMFLNMNSLKDYEQIKRILEVK